MKSKLFFTILFCSLGSLAFALKAGEAVPDFAAKNQAGKTVHLSDYRGKNVLVFFYPKDETSGCTVEAQGLRDLHDEFKKANTVVLGISRQDEKSHQAFIAKEKLPYDLLVDADGSVGKALGVGSFPIVGLSKRQSLLIDSKGQLVRFYDDVTPESHAKQVLGDIQKIPTAR